MTVQFNLLPAVKVEYLKAKRQQHLVVLVSSIASIAAVSIFVIFLSVVYGVQRKMLSDLSGKISVASSQLQSTKGLNQILTVQNQLKALPSLDSSKVQSSRLYGYVDQITPASASIANLAADFTQDTLNIQGSADNLATVDTYADTLKFATFSIKGQPGTQKAFGNVVLSTFTVSSSTTTYDLTLTFNPALFNASETVQLTVPNIVTTRSVIDQPTSLFQPSGGSQ